MKVLGFMNYASHDPGASIVCENNGKPEFMTISDERLSRVKYSYFFPVRSIKYCMDYFGIKNLDEIDLIVTDYGFLKQMSNTTPHYRKLEADYIKSKLKINFDKLEYVDHHLAHAASTFYPSGFEDAAILIVDGFGSNAETNSLFTADYKNGIRLIDKSYGQGIGIVYTAVTIDILNFGIGQEGKTMGLAAFGRGVEGDNILHLNPVYDGLKTDFSEFIDKCPHYELKQKIKACQRREDVVNKFYSKIAYELQAETEKCILHLANYAYKVTGKKKLCFAGGVGLNCVTNALLLDKTPFEQVFIQPASSDTGIPLGLALQGYYKNRNKEKKISFQSAFTGISYEKSKSKKLLEKLGIKFKESGPKEVAGLLSEGNIIGWFIQGSEIGPRALGHRSILADPRHLETKDLINAKVKHREMYRPFAPSILEEDAFDYFEMKTKSPFMLLAPLIKEEKRNEIPAVVHVDGTGRVQTVGKEADSIFYDLINNFKEITGIPVVLNTSFNDNGEPIVETPLDAVLCFLRTKIDYLYLDGLLIKKSDIKDVKEKVDYLEELRNNNLKVYYQEAIATLCRDYSTTEMIAFLKCYYPMHKYYSDIHTYVILQKEINKKAKLFKYFVTDGYHAGIIKSFMKEEYNLIAEQIMIIEDCLKNKREIPKDSFVLLYNLSLYLSSDDILNFYCDRSLVKLKPLYELQNISVNDFSVSNEYNSLKTWDKFYKDNVDSNTLIREKKYI